MKPAAIKVFLLIGTPIGTLQGVIVSCVTGKYKWHFDSGMEGGHSSWLLTGLCGA